jgi:hypothetical protein
VTTSAGFRTAIVELAKQIGFISMPDATGATPGDAANGRRSQWWRLGRRG